MSRVFLLLSVICATALGCQPMLRIYNDLEDGDITKDILFVMDQPDLLLKNLTVERMHTCPEGVWMGYRNEHFGGAEGERYILSGPRDGIFSCHFEGEGREKRIIRSVKVIGDPADYTGSALVTFPRTKNEGASLTYLEETTKANATFQSVILVGNQEVQLFTDEDFRGDLTVCIFPNNGDINSRVEFLAKNNPFQNGDELYTNVNDLEDLFGTSDFKSFKFGCDIKSQNRGKLL